MKNNFLLLILVCISISVCAQSDVAIAKWMQQSVTIDGVNREWGSLNFYDDQTKLSFGIANDSNNIYLCFESTDELNQMKLMRAGMKITLAAKGKSKHEASILFPLPQPKQIQASPASDTLDNQSALTHTVHNRETFRENFLKNHSTMEVTGFTTINGQVAIKDSSIQAALNWDSASTLVYEVSIAKKELFGDDYTVKKDIGTITLDVEINALKHEAGEGGNRSGSYGHSGTHGGGMHENGNSTHGQDFNNSREKYAASQAALSNSNNIPLNTKTSFKQKFSLNNGDL